MFARRTSFFLCRVFPSLWPKCLLRICVLNEFIDCIFDTQGKPSGFALHIAPRNILCTCLGCHVSDTARVWNRKWMWMWYTCCITRSSEVLWPDECDYVNLIWLRFQMFLDPGKPRTRIRYILSTSYGTDACTTLSDVAVGHPDV